MEINKEAARSRELEEAQEKADGFSGRTREEALGVLDHMRDPQALSPYFAQAMYELKLGLDRVKLPESAAREFFEELATEENCVCGRPIDEEVSAVIRERASQYLSSDDVSLLNSMKSAIQDSVGLSRVQSEIELTGELRELEILVARRRDALNELDELHLLAEQADPAVKRASEVIKDLDAKLAIINKELMKYNSTEGGSTMERTFSINVVADWLAEAEQRLAEITETLEMRDKRDILVRIIEDARERASALINAEICADANDRIGRLMPDNRIFIERIDKALILQGQEGGSAGETLSVAYAFLATLFNRSDHQLPFIVDSPAGPIDLAIRPRIGELIPRLTSQFVAFTISSEREGFVPRLKEAANGDVQFITLFRKGTPVPGNVLGDRLVSIESVDGIVVKGEEFFNSFQLDVEES